jgi:acetyl-CoA carboxylase alpha subunit
MISFINNIERLEVIREILLEPDGGHTDEKITVVAEMLKKEIARQQKEINDFEKTESLE